MRMAFLISIDAKGKPTLIGDGTDEQKTRLAFREIASGGKVPSGSVSVIFATKTKVVKIDQEKKGSK